MGQFLPAQGCLEAHSVGGSCTPDPHPRAEARSGGRLTTDAGPNGVSPEVRSAMLALLPSLRAFALSLTNAREIADDLVQDTLVRALAKIDQFEPGTNMGAWLLSSTANAAEPSTRSRTRTAPMRDACGHRPSSTPSATCRIC